MLEAVLAEPALAPGADLGRVQLVRHEPGDPLILTLDVARMTRTGDTTFNVLLRDGDVLHVPIGAPADGGRP